jgi:hypothetical protein
MATRERVVPLKGQTKHNKPCIVPPYLPHPITSFLVPSPRISSHLFSSILIYSHLFSSLLTYSHPFSSHPSSSHLFYSILIPSHLFSSILSSSFLISSPFSSHLLSSHPSYPRLSVASQPGKRRAACTSSKTSQPQWFTSLQLQLM